MRPSGPASVVVADVGRRNWFGSVAARRDSRSISNRGRGGGGGFVPAPPRRGGGDPGGGPEDQKSRDGSEHGCGDPRAGRASTGLLKSGYFPGPGSSVPGRGREAGGPSGGGLLPRGSPPRVRRAFTRGAWALGRRV